VRVLPRRIRELVRSLLNRNWRPGQALALFQADFELNPNCFGTRQK
jgi:hypothetical protein